MPRVSDHLLIHDTSDATGAEAETDDIDEAAAVATTAETDETVAGAAIATGAEGRLNTKPPSLTIYVPRLNNRKIRNASRNTH